MSKLETADSTGWIEIFRAGDYRSQGKGVISREDLDRVVRNYDPAFHEAPVTIPAAPVQLGHGDDAPAYAWVDRLAVNGDVLLAKEKQVDPQFNELRQAGRFKKRSASFYTGADGRVNGLRHVAWLGAQPPAVKGLQDVKFDDNGRQFIELNFGEESAVDKPISDQVKEYVASLFNPGGAAAKVAFSEEDARRIASEAVTTAVQPLQAQLAAAQAKLDAQAVHFAERELLLAGGEKAQRATAAVGRLKAAGRWIPAYDKAGVPLLFAELAKTTDTVEFGEAKKPVAPLDLLVDFLESLPAIVPAGRTFTGLPTASRSKGSSGDALTDAARARQKEKGISFSEALDQIAVEQPELTRPGRAAAGSV